MTHMQALFSALLEKGFAPQEDPEHPDRIMLRKTPDLDRPAAKPYTLGMDMWLRVQTPKAAPPDDLGAGVTLLHGDVRRTLYYLGKAVGTEEALEFFKISKHALQRALFFHGFIKEEPCRDWRDMDIENAFPSGW